MPAATVTQVEAYSCLLGWGFARGTVWQGNSWCKNSRTTTSRSNSALQIPLQLRWRVQLRHSKQHDIASSISHPSSWNKHGTVHLWDSTLQRGPVQQPADLQSWRATARTTSRTCSSRRNTKSSGTTRGTPKSLRGHPSNGGRIHQETKNLLRKRLKWRRDTVVQRRFRNSKIPVTECDAMPSIPSIRRIHGRHICSHLVWKD